MTSRHEVAARRQTMLLDLTAAIARGDLAVGARVDSGTELARRYALSKPIITAALEELIEDGTLRVKPSVGMFVAAPPRRANGTYVVLAAANEMSWLAPHPTTTAFKERITEHGGRSLVTDIDSFLRSRSIGVTDPVLGFFVLSGGRVDELADRVGTAVPIVVYAEAGANISSDVTYVDVANRPGGVLAATELLSLGCASLAFVGIHRVGSDLHHWSRERADGWEQVIRRHSPRAPLLHIQPRWDEPVTNRARFLAAAAAVPDILDCDACIGADDKVVMAIADELSRQRVPGERWPRMVGFEALPLAEDLVVGSVRPDWPMLGVSAADRLFDAARGRPRPSRTTEYTAMKLVRRPFVANR